MAARRAEKACVSLCTWASLSLPAGVHVRHPFYNGREASPCQAPGHPEQHQTLLVICDTVVGSAGFPARWGWLIFSEVPPVPQELVTGQRETVGFSTIRLHLQVTCSVFHSAKLTAESGCGSAATGLLQGLAQNLHWLR